MACSTCLAVYYGGPHWDGYGHGIHSFLLYDVPAERPLNLSAALAAFMAILVALWAWCSSTDSVFLAQFSWQLTRM